MRPTQTTATFRGNRRLFIGGSDARIIMGDDEEALLRLWREKRGEAPLLDKPSLPPPLSSCKGRSRKSGRPISAASIDKSELAHPEPRRVRDREHVRFVTKQPCLICGRRPSDPHHLRFAQHRALGRKVSDEFTVPLCRGHHRELHRHGDEAAWWKKTGIDPTISARELWLETHPQPESEMPSTAQDPNCGLNSAEHSR